uniref:Armadillo repeat containing 3 n=1 Tax=Scleropages formosus TaxID=113540 RepID=A0A8C9TB26_SCLFO
MGKKVKKEAEIPSKDVFDPISIESKKADTVVLMLNSAEEEVLTKACEAIHKYAEKGDESKGTLVSLGVLEPLSRLICHEDKLVRRNAFMALGVLACNDDVKKQLKKMDIIPSIISKLSPDEDVLIHEFATLCLASLSIEFTNKVHIFDNDGLDPLIHLLSSPDPDVQKNSAECIYNLVQDLQCRVAVCKMDGIPPLLELVHSEFPVIQQLALRTLDSITLEAEAWDAFREEQGLPRLLDFLAAKEFNDLHVEALHVLSNCLDDPSTMQLFRDAGGVNRLLQFMTAATLPEVQMSTAKVISKVAQSSEDRKLLHEHGVEKVLIHLLATDHDGLRTAVCQAVAAMSENLASRDTVRDLGIEAVVQLLSSESGEVRMAATFALSRLTCGSQLNTHAVYEAQGNEPLLQLIQRGKAEEVVHAAAVITNMAAHERLRADILVHGGMQSFAGLLQSADPCVLAAASLAVAALACDSDGRTQFRNTGGLVSLVKLLSSNSTEVRRNACWAARVCANDELTATEMCKLGALEILQDINLSTNRRNKFSQAAFQQLLDSNLSVKYSLTGYLSCTNITKDGFYDPGQVTCSLVTCGLGKCVSCSLVSEAMGGAVDRDNLHEFSWELQLSELKFEVQSNIIPIGKIKKGTFYHRALLYKTLADRIGLSCSLVRGEYNRAWNEVRLIEGPSKTPEYYILDLMHSPGLLLKSNSPEAVQYQTI